MDKKYKNIIVLAGLACLAYFIFSGSLSGWVQGLHTSNVLKITVVNDQGMPIGDMTSDNWTSLALIYTDPNNKLMFEPGYALYMYSTITFQYQFEGVSSGSVRYTWEATGTFVDAGASQSPTPPTGAKRSGSASFAVTGGSGTKTVAKEISLGGWSYDELDEDIPATGAKSLTMTLKVNAELVDNTGAVVKSVTGQQSVTIFLESSTTFGLSIVSISFSPWMESPLYF